MEPLRQRGHRGALGTDKGVMLCAFCFPEYQFRVPPCAPCLRGSKTLLRSMKYILVALLFLVHLQAQSQVRYSQSLNGGWRSIADDGYTSEKGFTEPTFRDEAWKAVTVPHNWDGYEGYRRLKHGNRHGNAWYRKHFTAPKLASGKIYFLYFEGVGSYATVWLNGKWVGSHKGGRTTFTLDVTDAIKPGATNLLAVKAEHSAMISDLPWVCGGCSNDRGWSEGSQPLGIFRPVHLVATNAVRIEPFGVHTWNDTNATAQQATVHSTAEIRNYGKTTQQVNVVQSIVAPGGKAVHRNTRTASLQPGQQLVINNADALLRQPRLWYPEQPAIYTAITEVFAGGVRVDSLHTSFGIRTVSWPIGKANGQRQLLVNGKPYFINGTCEYEHMMGRSHAFDAAQIEARIGQIKAAGFNAFRDAHQPHNLLYQQYFDRDGILWWPQFSAHVWFDTPEFREQFKQLIVEWVKERRNSPSAILWGLQNESKLPEAFARECTELIRKLDPTAAAQRLVTTCNGGEGTDWDVPQNWTGTYGGDPGAYGTDLKRQVLVGEYGAWRTLDLHTPGGFSEKGPNSEDKMTALMEWKIRQAEAVRDSVAGHFHWLFSSHENPGRVQAGEAQREMDRIGPVNYKGLLTAWGEPTDAFYMFRANYAPKEKEPMVYIASHTWPDRWTEPGVKNGIVVYSNCAEVELFNGAGISLGRQQHKGIGTHFEWNGVPIRYNILYAEGRINGRIVARDTIVLHHLPPAPELASWKKEANEILKPAPGKQYLYRVNCGGGDYRDGFGKLWQADRQWRNNRTWGSLSWTAQFAGMAPFYASQRTTTSPIGGTADDALFQSFRYGQDALEYRFPVPDGNYQLELYFTEPWYGIGGSINANGWRRFDVAVNGRTMLNDLDIWKEAGGHNRALKKTVYVTVKGGQLRLHFPNTKAGQAVISAIAISADKNVQPAPAAAPVFAIVDGNAEQRTWVQTGDTAFASRLFSALPSELYGASWLRWHQVETKPGIAARIQLTDTADVYLAFEVAPADTVLFKGWEKPGQELQLSGEKASVWQVYRRRFAAGAVIPIMAYTNKEGPTHLPLVLVQPTTQMEPPYDLKPTQRYEAETAELNGAIVAPTKWKDKAYVHFPKGTGESLSWQYTVGVGDKYALRIRYINQTGAALRMKLQLHSADGTLLQEEMLDFPVTPDKWALLDSSTATQINAGTYRLSLSAVGEKGLGVDYLEVQ